MYLDLESGIGFGENDLVGRTLRIGEKSVVTVTERDPRCKMITLDNKTAKANPEIMRHLASAHQGRAGVYGSVLVEGTVSPGDLVTAI